MERRKKWKLFGTRVVLVGAMFFALWSPQPANAQISVIADVQRAVQGSTGVLDFILKALGTVGQIGVKNGLRVFLDKIAYDTAVWLASGDEKQKPLLFTKDAETYLQEAGDAAVGEILNSVGQSIGIDLCNFDPSQSSFIQSHLPTLFTGLGFIKEKQPYRGSARCSVDDMRNNADTAFQNLGKDLAVDRLLLSSSPQSIDMLLQTKSSQFNSMLALVQAIDTASGETEKKEEAAAIERLKSDYQDQAAKISGYIQTPAAIIEQQQNISAEKAAQGELTLTQDPIADALSTFANTLISRLMQKAQSGLLAFLTEVDINASLSGASSTARGGGVREARLQFATYKTPPINKGGTVDIATTFATCPEQGADVTNCVINDEFKSAIDEKLTVRELAEQTSVGDMQFGIQADGNDITDPRQGLGLRAIRVLKQYSVVPVGWEIAAEYHVQKTKGQGLTLKDLIDAYDRCSQSDYSPYCGLVDPDWIIKAPEVFCKVNGYGENIGATTPVDTDGSNSTPRELQVNRLKSCLDPQTCLSEDDSGTCQAYGYCVKQKDIYRFTGDSCPAQQASCEVFTDSKGKQVGYLENTLNFDSCDAGSAGCEWRCGVFNEVDKLFQCKGNDSLYKTCTAANGCSTGLVTATGAACPSNCTIKDGGFTCQAQGDSGAVGCFLPNAENDIRAAINFDRDVQTCNANDASCMTFLPIAGAGANILSNSSFEYYDAGGRDLDPGSGNAPFTDKFAVIRGAQGADQTGTFCNGESNRYTNDICNGWTGSGLRAVNASSSGQTAVQLEQGNGKMFHVVETGHPLAGRTFALSYKYVNPSEGTAICSGKYRIDSADNTAVSTGDKTAAYQPGAGYKTITTDLFTFPSATSAANVGVHISAGDNCNVIIDDVQLVETTGSTAAAPAYSAYGAINYNLKTSVATQCSPGEVGCLLYTPQTGGSRIPVPGQITNPLSQECGNGDDFTNPACSQCKAEFVGCQAFVESDTPFRAPLKAYVNGLADQTAQAVAQRSGYYCQGTTTSCSPERNGAECGSGVACVPAVSIVPSTGQSCSAADVGCEEYVNLDKEVAGGESLEFYKYIKQCVKPTEEQRTTGQIDTYYTFEGTDQSGYQLRSWELKKSNLDGAPCTNLDLTGSTSQSASARCIDTTDTIAICSQADLGTNPDCTEYVDSSTGEKYYRLKSATITVSEECSPLRNTLDNRIYFSIASESQSCSAGAKFCREYKGPAASNTRFLIDDRFDTSVWAGGFASGSVVTAGSGQAMQIGSAVNSTVALKALPQPLSKEKSYVATFWAKGDSGQELTAIINKTNGDKKVDFGVVRLTGDWERYSVGPFIFQGDIQGVEEFGFEYDGNSVFIDNVQVQESSSVFMIHNSARTCNGFENCQQYTDTKGQTQFLKSFIKLCDQNKVGCQALINTQASDSPFAQRFTQGNADTNDDVISPRDTVQLRVVTDAARCNPAAASCQAFGLPTIGANGELAGFQTEYLMNDPDQYATTLCQQSQMSCQEYSASSGTNVYFKDPGYKLCTYDKAAGKWKKPDGSDCPLANPSDAPSQPKGPVCLGGPRNGFSCSNTEDCHTDADTSGICSSTVDNNTGWVGRCDAVYAGCTQYQDPNTDSLLKNSTFETDVTNVVGGTTTGDGIPDNWMLEQLSQRTIDNAGSGNSCVMFGKEEARTYEGKGALVLEPNHSDGFYCGVTAFSGQGNKNLAIDSNRTYSLRVQVWAEGGVKYGIGLRYFNDQGQEIFTSTGAKNSYDIAALSNGGVRESQWIKYSALVGPTAQAQFPAGTAYVRVVAHASGDGKLILDNLDFSQVADYTYINESVDGAPESDENTCNGDVNNGEGCVAFREVGDKSNTTVSTIEKEADVAALNNMQFAGQNCVSIGTGINGQVLCDGTPNAADTNRVIHVERDRECAEWLACASSSQYQVNGQNVSTCLQLGTCRKRNPETNVCEDWVIPPSAENVGTGDQLDVTVRPGDASTPETISNYSGFAKVGVRWIDGGSGTDGVTYGYYPADWIPERGTSYAAIQRAEIIQNGSFEAVYCKGEASSGDELLDEFVDIKKDSAQKCTLDIHCRTTDLDTAINQEYSGQSRPAGYATYEAGLCDTVSGGGGTYRWENWGTQGRAKMAIVDYDDGFQQYEKVSPDADSEITASVAARNLDLNNVLYVAPEGGGSDSGVGYAGVPLTVSTKDSSFVVSFDAKYAQAPGDNKITVYLDYGNGVRDTFVQEMQFTTGWQSYTLGSMKLANLPTGVSSATLFLGQKSGGNASSAFYIDNVSMRPALEAGPDGRLNGNASGGLDVTDSPLLIARSCRAYPSETASQCNYRDKGGVIYEGWKGYCLQREGIGRNRCIAWWPVSTVAGEVGIEKAAIQTRWSAQAPAYHCLVAKGNEEVGACSGSGVFCSTNAQCGSGEQCLGNNTNQAEVNNLTANVIKLTETREDRNRPYEIRHHYTTSNYQLIHKLSAVYIDSNPQIGNDFSNKEVAAFVKFGESALKVEQTVHISEIRNILFSYGEPRFYEDYDAANELRLLDEPEGKHYRTWTLDRATKGTNTDFQSAALEEIDPAVATDTTMWKIDTSRNFDNPYTEAESWNFNAADDADQDKGVMAVQYGFWCGGAPCTTSSTSAALQNADLVYVKGISTLKANDHNHSNTPTDSLYNVGTVGNNDKPLNPFHTFSADLGENSALWNTVRQIGGDNGREDYIGGVSGVPEYTPSNLKNFYTYFRGRNAEDAAEELGPGRPCYGEANENCGNNIVAVKFDFEGGYLKNVYLLYWNGFFRVDISQMQDVEWKFELKEPCLLAVPSATVNSDGSINVFPWRERVASDSNYTVPGLGYPYQLKNSSAVYSFPLFGMIGPDGNKAPNELGGDTADGKTNLLAKTGSLPMVYLSGSNQRAGSGLPYACIGECSNTICQNNLPYKKDQFKSDNSVACNASQWVSMEGICVGSNNEPVVENGQGVPCDPGAPASNSCGSGQTCKATGSASGDESYGTDDKGGAGNYSAKLMNALRVAHERYKMLFVTTAEPYVYMATPVNNNKTNSNKLTKMSFDDKFLPSSFTGSSGLQALFNQYTNMPACSGDRGDTEYCAERPEVREMKLNGRQNSTGTTKNLNIFSGDTVTLNFRAVVDENQQPLNKIRVQWKAPAPGAQNFSNAFTNAVTDDWGAPPLSAHSYQNVYTCQPSDAAYNPGSKACEYRIRVQIQDSWGFCSGSVNASSNADYRGECKSYDEYNGTIFVKPRS